MKCQRRNQGKIRSFLFLIFNPSKTIYKIIIVTMCWVIKHMESEMNDSSVNIWEGGPLIHVKWHSVI